jgi:L-2,4-diaminobutyrate decarboxylase
MNGVVRRCSREAPAGPVTSTVADMLDAARPALEPTTAAGTPQGLQELGALVEVGLRALHVEAERRAGPIPGGGPVAFERAAADLPESFIPDTAGDPLEVIENLARLSGRWAVDLASPAALARMQCAPITAAVAAELIAATLNQGLQVWESGPFAGLVEGRLLADLAKLLGYPADAGGAVTSGGTQSNLMALMLAREAALGRIGVDVEGRGLAGIAARPKILCTPGAHVSVRLAAQLLGLGRDALVEVEADRLGRMVPPALESAIERLPAGSVPVAVVATAGSTDFGAFDPLVELAQVAARQGIWLHIDAAYGGAVMFSERLAPLAAGLERGDSVALDFHKFGWTPASSGILLVRSAELLTSLTQRAAYLTNGDDAGAGFATAGGASIQTTRRFDALKIAATLLSLGRAELGGMVERCHELAKRAAGAIEASPKLELAATPVLSTVVFRCIPGRRSSLSTDALNAAVRRRLIERGSALVGRTVLPDASGRPAVFLKLVLLTPGVSDPDVEATVAAIASTATEVERCA